MPRVRILALCLALVLVTAGLGAGLAWRWMVLDVLHRRAGRPLRLADLGDCLDLRAGILGLVCLPITWGGVIFWWLEGWAWGAVALAHAPQWTLWAARAGAIGGLAPLLAVLYGVGADRAVPRAVHCASFRRPVFGPWWRHSIATGIVILASELLPHDWSTLLLRAAIVILAPALGAVVALRCTIDQYEMRLVPVASQPGASRFAAAALGVLWFAVIARLALPTSDTPPLVHGGIDSTDCGRSADAWAPYFAQRVLASRGGPPAGDWRWSVPAGSVLVASPAGRLVWATRWNGRGQQVLEVAHDRMPGAPIEVVLGARSVVRLPVGLVAVEVDAADVRRVVRIGNDLSRRVGFALPPGQTDETALARDPARGLVVAWRRRDPQTWPAPGSDRLEWVHIGEDLAPTGPVQGIAAHDFDTMTGTYGRGRLACFTLHPSGGPRRILALGPLGQMHRPGVWARIADRAGAKGCPLLGLAALQLALVAWIARAGRLGRHIRRARRRGRFWSGVVEPIGESKALLLLDGQSTVQLDLSHAAVVGAATGTPPAGPCLIIDGELEPDRVGYRTGPPVLRARRVFAGDSAAADRTDRARRSRALRLAVALGWLLGVLPLIAALAG